MNSVQLVIRQESIKSNSYNKIIQETEQLHSLILKTLQCIQTKEVQDIFYILKPTQQLYNSVCGLLCFVAGVDKEITTDYVFLQQRDWVFTQSLFCKNYDQIANTLSNIQQILIKKKINITNIKEALKFNNQENNPNVQTIADKLQQLLYLAINYYTNFYKILKLNKQELEKQQQPPDELKNYMLNKMNENLQQSDEEIDQQQLQQEEGIAPTPKDHMTPQKLSKFKDFNSYQKGVMTCNPKVSLTQNPITYFSTMKKQHNYLSKSPIDQVSVSSFTKQVSNIAAPKSPRSPIVVKQKQQIQKKEKPVQPPLNLADIADKLNSNDPQIEQIIKQKIEEVNKQAKKLKGIQKSLQWDDERNCKKVQEQQEKQYQSEQIEQNKQYLSRITEVKQKEVKKPIVVKQQVEQGDEFKQQRVMSLYKELERGFEEISNLERDTEWMRVRNQGIQKY